MSELAEPAAQGAREGPVVPVVQAEPVEAVAADQLVLVERVEVAAQAVPVVLRPAEVQEPAARAELAIRVVSAAVEAVAVRTKRGAQVEKPAERVGVSVEREELMSVAQVGPVEPRQAVLVARRGQVVQAKQVEQAGSMAPSPRAQTASLLSQCLVPCVTHKPMHPNAHGTTTTGLHAQTNVRTKHAMRNARPTSPKVVSSTYP